MPVLQKTVSAIVKRWAAVRGVIIPESAEFVNADAFDAKSFCKAIRGWSMKRRLSDDFQEFITSQTQLVFTMRERMHITLGPVAQVVEKSPGKSTTVCATRSRSPKELELWTLDDLPDIPDDLWAAMPAITLDTINGFTRRGLTLCTAETRIHHGTFDLLSYVIECMVDPKYSATQSNAGAVGQPDVVVWQSLSTQEEKLALVVECKTPWAFDLDPNASLAEIYNSHKEHHENWAKNERKEERECPPGLTVARKVFHAVRQLYAYMTSNSTRYGILTTFTTTFLFKQNSNGKLFISKGLAADGFDPMTVLEAIARLLMICHLPAAHDLSEAELGTVQDPSAQEMPRPSKSAGKKKRNKSKEPTPKRQKANHTQAPLDERELVLITDLPNYHVIAGGGSASIVATELDDIAVAIKVVDTCKKPDLLDELQRECDAYAVLKALQGDCIPMLVRPTPVVLWEGMLDGLVLSMIKGRTLEEMGMDGIATIPLECRHRAVQDLRKIHSLGVLHGDMAERNLIWCEDDHPRIAFIDFGQAITCCNVQDNRLKYEEFELCAMLQIRYADDSDFAE